MKTAGSRFTSSGLFIALLLVAFSASGLMAGLMARQVSGRGAGAQPTSTALSSAAQTATAAANVTPTASGTFALKIQLSPYSVRVGQSVQVTVMACTPYTDLACGPNTTPLPGVICTLQQTPNAPSSSGAWPSPLTTDSSGQAIWGLLLSSQMAPGSYEIAVRGDTAAYHASRKTTLVVTA